MERERANSICESMMAAEREAGRLVLQAHDVLAECKTGRRDVVTAYDRQVQGLLTERLRAALPGARFFCEENDQQDDLRAEHLFVIDPIDGTMNFVHRLNHSGISVAYWHRGEPLAGAVYNPYMDEMFHAVRGGGAFLNGRPIHVEPVPLSGSLVCVGTAPYRPELTAQSFAMIERLFRAGLDVRRQGAAVLDLCSVAAGRAGLYAELSVCLWDYAAGALIVQEAGGECLTVEGKALPRDGGKTTILAGGSRAVADFLALPKSGNPEEIGLGRDSG